MQPDTVRATGFRYPQNTVVDLEILDHIYKQVYKIKKIDLKYKRTLR